MKKEGKNNLFRYFYLQTILEVIMSYLPFTTVFALGRQSSREVFCCRQASGCLTIRTLYQLSMTRSAVLELVLEVWGNKKNHQLNLPNR